MMQQGNQIDREFQDYFEFDPLEQFTPKFCSDKPNIASNFSLSYPLMKKHSQDYLMPTQSPMFHEFGAKKSNKAQLKQVCEVSTRNTHWTEQEEIILVGVVTDNSLLYSTQSTWENIHKSYTEAIRRYNQIHGESFSPRTSCACQKHWRTMHLRTKQGELPIGHWLQLYHDEWSSAQYNKQHHLFKPNSKPSS